MYCYTKDQKGKKVMFLGASLYQSRQRSSFKCILVRKIVLQSPTSIVNPAASSVSAKFRMKKYIYRNFELKRRHVFNKYGHHLHKRSNKYIYIKPFERYIGAPSNEITWVVTVMHCFGGIYTDVSPKKLVRMILVSAFFGNWPNISMKY